MKYYLSLPLALLLFTVTTSSVAVAKPKAPTKECKDCGCDGAAKDGKCPTEKENKCHCPKK